MPHLFRAATELMLADRPLRADGAGSGALLVIAHPDDECMFFTPTVLGLARQGITAHVLCLSTGNFDGLGATRSRELRASCVELGVDERQTKPEPSPNRNRNRNRNRDRNRNPSTFERKHREYKQLDVELTEISQTFEALEDKYNGAPTDQQNRIAEELMRTYEEVRPLALPPPLHLRASLSQHTHGSTNGCATLHRKGRTLRRRSARTGGYISSWSRSRRRSKSLWTNGTLVNERVPRSFPRGPSPCARWGVV